MFNVYERLDSNGHFMTCSLLNESVQTSSIGEIFNVRVNIELGGSGMKMLLPMCKIAYFVDNITKHAPPKIVPGFSGHRKIFWIKLTLHYYGVICNIIYSPFRSKRPRSFSCLGAGPEKSAAKMNKRGFDPGRNPGFGPGGWYEILEIRKFGI